MAPTCEHGTMVHREGEKNGKPWSGWFCPSPRGTPNQCAPIFERKGKTPQSDTPSAPNGHFEAHRGLSFGQGEKMIELLKRIALKLESKELENLPF